jgi:DNA-binding transcriptional LysR family regulator
MVALVARNHPLASRSAIALRELKDTPFIMFEPGFSLHRIMLDASRRSGFEPTIGALSSQIEFMIELVGAGMGVAFLPRMIAAQRRHPAVDHVVLNEPVVEWSMSMAWRRNGYLSDAAQAWRSLVAEKFGDR